MAKSAVIPVDTEIEFGRDEIIVSKTDSTGRILYANDVFCRVAEMDTREMIGQPHSIIRHPDMPRAVFKLLWDHIQAGEEIFAYVKNMSKTGKYYWVIAHVTPTTDAAGKVLGYHANLRCPSRKGIADIEPLYNKLLAEEQRHQDPGEGLAASCATLEEAWRSEAGSYDEFIWTTGE